MSFSFNAQLTILWDTAVENITEGGTTLDDDNAGGGDDSNNSENEEKESLEP